MRTEEKANYLDAWVTKRTSFAFVIGLVDGAYGLAEVLLDLKADFGMRISIALELVTTGAMRNAAEKPKGLTRKKLRAAIRKQLPRVRARRKFRAGGGDGFF